MSVFGRRLYLPSGQCVLESTNTATGDVLYELEGSDLSITALDAMELGRLAERALRGLTVPDLGREWKSTGEKG